MQFPGIIPFAHRGGAVGGLEHTAAAFENAIALGYHYIETDVRTRDGVALLFHDARLDRVTDRVGLIQDMDYRDVAEARVRGLEPIPRFDDVLHSWPGLYLSVDLKDEASIDSVTTLLKATDSVERVSVTSFVDSRIVAARQRLGKDLCTGVGTLGVLSLWAASAGFRSHYINRWVASAAVVQVPLRLGAIRLGRRFVDHAHRQGLVVHVWTVNDTDSIQSALDIGVDRLITDRVSLVKGELQTRGLWVELE